MDPVALIPLALLLLTVAAGCAAVGCLAAIVYVIRHYIHTKHQGKQIK